MWTEFSEPTGVSLFVPGYINPGLARKIDEPDRMEYLNNSSLS